MWFKPTQQSLPQLSKSSFQFATELAGVLWRSLKALAPRGVSETLGSRGERGQPGGPPASDGKVPLLTAVTRKTQNIFWTHIFWLPITDKNRNMFRRSARRSERYLFVPLLAALQGRKSAPANVSNTKNPEYLFDKYRFNECVLSTSYRKPNSHQKGLCLISQSSTSINTLVFNTEVASPRIVPVTGIACSKLELEIIGIWLWEAAIP